MVTSWGFSVSSRSISRLTSGNFDLGAATMRRLEVLSGQMRTCCGPPGDAALGGGGPPPPGCSGLPPGEITTPGGIDDEGPREGCEEARLGADGGGDCAF